MAGNDGGGGGGGGGGVSWDPIKDARDSFQSVINEARAAVDRTGRNIGKNLKDVTYAVGTGDFNNIGNSIINAGSNYVSAGQMDANLESGRERAINAGLTEKEQSEQDAAIKNEMAREADKQRRVRNILEGSARYRLLSPGSAATSIIPATSDTNTLLTIRGR